MEGKTQAGPFYKMIKNLFETNSLVLFGQISNIPLQQETDVAQFIESYYRDESLGYPAKPLKYDKAAAIWSSKILFHAAQLVMYREHNADSLESFFPKYTHPKTPEAIATADLCLRFVPNILKYLEQIDIEDKLIPILKELLTEWHYSGLLSKVNLQEIDLATILENDCLSQLYINRIIDCKRKQIGERKELKPLILSALGNYKNEYWKDFNLTI